ncbi:MAG TPA: hypothetical protein VIM11_19630, partial [Tepidisphaeraceae bacterium]
QSPSEPNLKYRLIPARSDLGPGNAAQAYLLAFGRHIDGLGFSPFYDMIRADTNTFPLEKARTFISQSDAQTALGYIELASRRETCTWDLPDREQGIDTQTFNDLNRAAQWYGGLLSLRARVAIADGQFDEALHTLQTGLTLGKNLSEGAPLAQALDGIYVDALMLADVQQLIQKPGAPNLYWPLMNLPRRVGQLRATMEADAAMLYRTLPGLRHAERLSADQAKEVLERLRSMAGKRDSIDVELIAAMMRAYPTAKRGLVEAKLLTAEEAQTLPANAVVLAWYHTRYRQALDRLDKYLGLAPQPAYIGSFEAMLESERNGDGFNPIFATVLRYPEAILQFAVADRQIAMLAIVEAIRAFAAAHGGALPSGLDQLSPQTPAPIDPVTATPFSYQVVDQVATLKTPPPNDFGPPPTQTWHIHIAR